MRGQKSQEDYCTAQNRIQELEGIVEDLKRTVEVLSARSPVPVAHDAGANIRFKDTVVPSE